MGNKYFLSHSSKDKDICKRIRVKLEQLGHTCWLDEYDIKPGESIPKSIADGIYGCDQFIILLSTSAKDSNWVDWELNVATHREINEHVENFIIPASIERCDLPKLITHKNVFTLNVNDENSFINSLTGKKLQSVTTNLLPVGAFQIHFKIVQKYTHKKSTRHIEDSFWRSVKYDGPPYSYFPALLCKKNVSPTGDKLFVSLSEEERESVTAIDRFGNIEIIETIFLGAQHPILHLRRTTKKIARLIKFADKFSIEAEVGGGYSLKAKITSSTESITPLYAPEEIENYHPLARPVSTFSGRAELNADWERDLLAGSLTDSDLAKAAWEIQADLYHPFRMKINELAIQGGREFSLRLSKKAVLSSLAELEHANWS